MVPVRQRDPASPGHPSLTSQHSRAWRTLSSQGLFQVRLSNLFLGSREEPGGAFRCLPGPGSAGFALPCSHPAVPYSRCLLPLLGSHTLGGPGVS